jgi:hypothetical protein
MTGEPGGEGFIPKEVLQQGFAFQSRRTMLRI